MFINLCIQCCVCLHHERPATDSKNLVIFSGQNEGTTGLNSPTIKGYMGLLNVVGSKCRGPFDPRGPTLLILTVFLLRVLRFSPTIPLLGGGMPP